MDALRSDLGDSEDEITIFPEKPGRRSLDAAPTLGVTPERPRGWRRYGQSLKYLFPVRPYFPNDGVSRIDQAGCFSFITYAWVFSYLWSAYRGLIPNDPQWSCSIYDSANVNVSRLEFLWKEEVVNSQKRPGGPSLIRAVRRFIQTRILVCCLIFFFCLAFGFIGPTCLIRQLIEYAEQRGQQHLRLSYGLALVFSLLIVELFRVLSYGATWAISYRTGVRVRGAVLGLLYKKVMLGRGISQKGVGEIINIFANDGQRIFDAITFLPLVLMGPSVLIGGLIYLCCLLGPWSLLGVGVFVVFDVMQYSLGKTMVKYRKLAVAKTEERVRITNEILHSIRLIKTNAWEYPFIDKITNIRLEEKRYLQAAGYAQSMAIAAGPVVPVVAAVVTFLACVLVAEMAISASQAFTAITVFFVMVLGIRMIPYGMRYCSEAAVALRKIQHYYLMKEIVLLRLPTENKAYNLVIENGTFAWDTISTEGASNGAVETELQALSSEEPTAQIALRNVNVALEKKQLVGVCGPVGCGKSSLLRAIVGELVHQDGNVHLNGTLAYCPQEPWLFNATLRENIVFGEPFDNQKYYRVLYACGLNTDINNMTAGDQTEVGERGVTLSGGQKARVSLARAVYSGRQVYLLDDVLASLDGSVAKHVFDYAIKGVLAAKSILLVTTDPQYLSKCDQVIYIKNGRIADQGAHDALLLRSDDYASFCRTSSARHMEKIDDVIEDLLSAADAPDPGPVFDSDSEREYVQRHTRKRSRNQSTLSGADSLFDIPSAVDGHMMEAEEDFGLMGVSRHVYKNYIGAMGGLCMLLILFLTFAANVASSVFASTWLALWLKDNEERRRAANSTFRSLADDPQLSYYATVYGTTLILLTITTIIKAVTFVNVTLKASNSFHRAMLNRVLHASMLWFDSTPTGRIINRFSKDMDEMDVKIPFSFEAFLQNIFQICAYLVVIAWVFPYFLVACVPMTIIFGLFVACFRAGIRSLKRAENVSRSPLFSHITASIHGRASVLAYGQVKQFNDRLKHLLDANSGAMFMFQSAMRWLAVWLDLLVVLVTFVTSLLLVLVGGSVSPAYAGVALAFSIQMSGIFQFAVRMHAEFEAKMTSVERIQFYIDHVDQEPEWYNRHSPAPFDWPQAGRISFRDVTLKYRETGPTALKGVSFDVKPLEKIGIVGRTGSGKSSLVAALLRLYPVTSGTVSIDGLDIARMGLHELRAKISAIPQDPILFAGSIRFNLDPVNVRSDQELWSALEKVHLKPLVSGMDRGLNSEIVEGGRNLSSGQRQLMCMARALLRHVRIILLDEATSSLDGQTDDSVQKCLSESFEESTKLVIAHRLASVMDSSRILYLENGRVVEFDSVDSLMRDQHSRYSQVGDASLPVTVASTLHEDDVFEQ